jgi:glyoxylase-like metal-dependent hydrolase (beta-lactamase superfamily II)
MMTKFMCATCGTQFSASDVPPAACPICEDERQYIGWNGQQWTTLEELRESHHNTFTEHEPNLTAIQTEPSFAINQRAFLIETPQGNLLWDCIALLDDKTINFINERGGIKAIAISHPHYYSTMLEWSHAFDVPIYIHEEERDYVVQPGESIQYWEGETLDLWEGLTLIRCGGHYKGSQVLHWAAGADGQAVLLTGDTILVVQDRRFVTFMYSYPNMIPVSENTIRKIVASIEPHEFERLYSAFKDKEILTDAKGAVMRSAQRYIAALRDEHEYDLTVDTFL